MEGRRLEPSALAQFFEDLPDYCFVSSPDGTIIRANPAACARLGFAKEDISGKTLGDLFEPIAVVRFVELAEKWSRRGFLQNEELLIRTKDGQARTVLLNAVPVSDMNGNTEQIVVSAVVHEREMERLRMLQSAIACSDDAIISLNLAGYISDWNPGAERMYGYAEHEIRGRHLSFIIPEELRAAQDKILRSVQSGSVVRDYETVRVAKSGKRLDVSLSVCPLRDFAGKIAGICTIGRDITDRKKAETALEESETRFRLIANSAPVMIWTSGTDKSCTYFNDSWLAFTGNSFQSELGNGWSEGVHPEDLKTCMETYSRSFDLRKPFEMDYRLRRYDGDYRWIRDKGVPVFADDGSFRGYVGSAVDVTDQKTAEEVLSTVSRKLIEAQERERTWIGRELHDDINQRIALVTVQLDALKKGLPDSTESVAQRLEELRASLMGIGNDVQALSRHLHSSRLEYLGLGKAASILCRELAEKNALEISFESRGIPTQLSQDVALSLFRVLQEALQNAIKHSGSQRIEVNLTSEGSTIELSVRDYGTGFIPEEVSLTGGLGLISMRERLKSVNGSFVVDSQAHQGTLIRACVPFHT